MSNKNYLKIKKEISEKKEIRLNDLVKDLDISLMTVNRVIQQLESEGILVRTRGGAMLIEEIPSDVEVPFTYKINLERDLKQVLVEKAVEIIGNAKHLYLDDSSEAYLILRQLSKDKIIYTSSVETAKEAADLNFSKVSIIGGSLNNLSKGIMHTFDTEIIKRQTYDFSIIGARGYDDIGNLYDLSHEKIEVKEIFMNSSKKVLALVDSTKHDKKLFYKFTPTNLILITNKNSKVKSSSKIELYKI